MRTGIRITIRTGERALGVGGIAFCIVYPLFVALEFLD